MRAHVEMHLLHICVPEGVVQGRAVGEARKISAYASHKFPKEGATVEDGYT